jgi:hypothetical protein
MQELCKEKKETVSKQGKEERVSNKFKKSTTARAKTQRGGEGNQIYSTEAAKK